ncbi:MAG: cobalamin-dependent protein [Nitrospira sp.]|nr:cobalamin-dependent protein [Nitrospira sp.]MDH4371262.1 cobalamin-dependent protein [Nitrospira sp.]MDH5348678.1 cobalamin-dependent protein [Nitrospira sp.]MDH5498888.1 cobalamin-dependent protein [Nitrospira sp.]MDH5726334.1 cobalamin-dependent protein [Nitrospira sp.]
MKIEYSKGNRASKELILLNRQQFEATSGRKMKVMLIFPPDWFPSEPYLSLPSLTAVLRQAGHTVIQKDINCEMWDWYFGEDFLKKVLRRVPQQLDRLRKLSKKRELSEGEMDVQLALCEVTRPRMEQLIRNAEEAKRIIRGEQFYDIDKLEWSLQVFREVMSIISLVYFPARICMPPMETNLSYKVFVSSEIMDAVNDPQVNIYRDVFEHLVKPAIEAERPDVIGISIVLQQQMFSTMTFCALIKQHFPHVHITIGGNTVTRLRDVLPQSPLFQYFDSAVVYEGETAFVQLVSAVGAKRSLAEVPNAIYKDETGIHTSPTSYAEDLATLPPPDFDGLPLEKYFVPTRILPYLATRGCYWGRCEFCDHGEGYTAGYRSKKIQDALADIQFLRDKYGAQYFHFTDESYPPALFRKLARGLIESRMGIHWTTHMRFEKSLLDEQVWQDAKESGCRYLHFGYESGVERVLQLMDKATTIEVMTKHLTLTAEAGIWNHCMGFFGFPGETKEEAWQSVQFLEQNKNHVHSLGFGTFDLGRHNPVAKHPDRWGVTAYKNPEWDLALDYYYTVKNGMSIEEAERVFEQFERHHNPGWDLRLYIREYIFLYISRFGLGKLADLQFQSAKTTGVTHTLAGKM